MADKEIRAVSEDRAEHGLYQVSTLQALLHSYMHRVVTVAELLRHGDTGLGTFEDFDGEMIVLDGECYRATHDGTVYKSEASDGVPFAVVTPLYGERVWEWGEIRGAEALITALNKKIAEHAGLNSMHIVRIDGSFDLVDARSELSSREFRHARVPLKEILSTTQCAFKFANIQGSLICLYFPKYMEGICLPGWHLHFISADRSKGGHVFDLYMREGRVRMDKVTRLEIQLPKDEYFDSYDLQAASPRDMAAIEQGKA